MTSALKQINLWNNPHYTNGNDPPAQKLNLGLRKRKPTGSAAAENGGGGERIQLQCAFSDEVPVPEQT